MTDDCDSHNSAPIRVREDDGSLERPAVRIFLRGASRCSARRAAPPARARPRRGCVPGDVPEGTSRVRSPSQRRQPPCLGPDDRPPRCGRPASPARSSAAGARAANRGTPAYAELGELADELPRKERAAVVLRYGYDLSTPPSAPRSARARTPHAGGLVRCPQTSKEDAMTVPTRQSFPRSRGCGRAARRCVRPHRLSGRDAARRDDRARPLQDLVRPPARPGSGLAGPNIRRSRPPGDEAGRPRSPPAGRVFRRHAHAIRVAGRPSPVRPVQSRDPETACSGAARRGHDLRGACPGRGPPSGRASGRNGDEPESDSDRAPLPPSRRCDRLARRLRRRARAQGELLKLEGALGSSLLDM